MAFRLKRAVQVAADPGRDDYQPNMMVTLDAGTALSAIAASEKAQLAPDHFEADDESDKTPNDWRPAEAQERDREQREFLDRYMDEHGGNG